MVGLDLDGLAFGLLASNCLTMGFLMMSSTIILQVFLIIFQVSFDLGQDV
jgi:hypothetical protein